MIKFEGLQKSDKQFFVMSIVVPLVAWWVFSGRNRYSVKGMK